MNPYVRHRKAAVAPTHLRRPSLAAVFWIFSLCFTATFCVRATASPGADVIEVTVLGTAPIQNRDLADARNAALDQGLNKAVQLAVERLIPGDSLAKSLKTLGELVLVYGQGLVKEYRVLAQDQTKNIYIVLLSVSVIREDLEDALRAAGFDVAPQKEAKTALVFLQGSKVGQEAIRQAVAETLSRNGYRFTETGAFDYDISRLSVLTWADLGRQKEADVVLFCTWDLSCEAADTEAFSSVCRGTAEAKLVDVSSSMLLDYPNVEVEVMEKDRAVAEEKAAADLASALARTFLTEEERRKDQAPLPLVDYRVIIANVTSFGQFEGVRDALRNRVPEVASVQLRSIVPSEFELQVGFKGSAEELTQRLSALLFSGFQLNVRRDDEQRIVATILAAENVR